MCAGNWRQGRVHTEGREEARSAAGEVWKATWGKADTDPDRMERVAFVREGSYLVPAHRRHNSSFSHSAISKIPDLIRFFICGA